MECKLFNVTLCNKEVVSEASWWLNDNKNISASGTKKTKVSQVNILKSIYTENIFQMSWRQ